MYSVPRSQTPRRHHIPFHQRTTEAARLLGHGSPRPANSHPARSTHVLTLLRELEESVHVPLLDDAYDGGSDRSPQGCVTSLTGLSDVQTDTSFSVSVMRAGGRQESILVWDEEEFHVAEETKRAARAVGRAARARERMAIQPEAGPQDRSPREAARRNGTSTP